MAIQKLYAHRVPDGDKRTKSGAAKMITTWHLEFNEVEHKRGISKVGTGPAVEVKKTPFAMGDGEYANMDKITDVELDGLRKANVVRIAQPRLNNALDAIDGLINSAENTASCQFEQSQVDTILGHLTAKINRLQEALIKNINPAAVGAKGKVKTAVTL